MHANQKEHLGLKQMPETCKRESSNCTWTGSLLKYCNTFSGWVGLSNQLLETGIILYIINILPVLVLLFGYSLTSEDGHRPFIRLDGLRSDLMQMDLYRDSSSWSCQSTAPWKDWPITLCLSTYLPNGNLSMAGCEVQIVFPTCYMTKLCIFYYCPHSYKSLL